MGGNIARKVEGFSGVGIGKHIRGGIALLVTDQDLVGGIAMIRSIGVGIDIHVVFAGIPGKCQGVPNPYHDRGVRNSKPVS